MDPNACLERMLEIAREMVNDDNHTSADQLAEAVLNLNEWITKGGFLPLAWRHQNDALIEAAKNAAELEETE